MQDHMSTVPQKISLSTSPHRSGVCIQGIAGPPETALNLNQGSFSAHSYFPDQIHWNFRAHLHSSLLQCIFSLHWILQAVYIQCCTAGTLQVHWTHTPLRWGSAYTFRDMIFLVWYLVGSKIGFLLLFFCWSPFHCIGWSVIYVSGPNFAVYSTSQKPEIKWSIFLRGIISKWSIW